MNLMHENKVVEFVCGQDQMLSYNDNNKVGS